MTLTRFPVAVASAMVLTLLLASSALASGPATSHRGTVLVDCGGQTYTVAVENGGKNVGAAQVVDASGHAILVSGTSTVTDTRTDQQLESWTSGHGAGHDSQAQTQCVATFTYIASDAFGGGPYPAGVLAGDTIVYEIDFWVVLQA